MANYVRAANPIWFMVDHEGLPLNDNYYAFFLSNTFPYIPQLVARDSSATSFWTGGIVQFEPSGTLPNNLYFNDELTYRIEIRRGNTQNDPLIWEINNFVPPAAGGGGDTTLSISSSNQASNPQFAFVSFNRTCTITTSGDHEIAPGWSLELTGAGTVTATQIRTISGNNAIPGNPSYALELSLSGWTTAYLRQRFEQNGSLFAGTNAIDPSGITMSVTAKSNDNINHPISLLYRQEGESAVTVASNNLDVNDYAVIEGAVQLDISANSTVNPDSYTDMLVELPVGADISLTNLQVIGEFLETTPVSLPFDQEPVERQLDHLYHYYSDSLLTQPRINLLTGWNFALNPWQFRTTAATNVANNAYTADQTILIQRAYVASATANNVSVGRATFANNYAYQVTAVTADNQFAILQYIDPATIRPYWGSNLSSMLQARLSTSHATTVRVKARLIHRITLPITVAQNEPVQSWTAGGDPVFSAGWTAVTPLNDPVYTLTSSSDGISFDKFVLPASGADAMTVGLFIYTIDNMNQNATADSIYFDKVSLVPNDFATEASPETFEQCLGKCQYYYQKSFLTGTVPAQNVGVNTSEWIAPQTHADLAINTLAIFLKFQTTMRATPAITIYNPAAANSQVRNISINADCSAFATSNITTKGFYGLVTTAAASSVGDILGAHWTADARLGI